METYNNRLKPAYPYLHAISSYSAVVQLYARSGQLPTKATIANRKRKTEDTHTNDNNTDKFCRYGCNEIEMVNHIFVVCPKFKKWRNETIKNIDDRIKNTIITYGKDLLTPLKDIVLIDKNISLLFTNSKTLWHLGISQFYLGHVPRIGDNFIPKNIPNKLTRNKLSRHIYNIIHHRSIMLSACIWGEVQRESYNNAYSA